ncbi:hypothetical protein NHN26_13515 [Rhodovulum tesquicola]|uniref:hypothetical protein n=1 Tax=Rhodovulum TaxID=34008 RepID=UPI0017EA08CE|nr:MULTISPECIES: hypothetical protein [Rhodovulum]MCO8146240.1 hypothetical protein [Rhodovulum tesquicola]HDR27998.1 hypothetical protein [Rhodovulum sp.]
MADGHEEKTSIWTEAGIWVVVLAAMALWALAILKWGVLGLYMPAVISVPIILLILVWISRG